ncbi:hypothetical protein CWO90_29705 [Bradyrhizobium sp. Leo121]|nr:hypothetical protein CWO90_29705 [Bradyrhizobium sp. Leo121]
MGLQAARAVAPVLAVGGDRMPASKPLRASVDLERVFEEPSQGTRRALRERLIDRSRVHDC